MQIQNLEDEVYLLFVLDCSNCDTCIMDLDKYWDGIDEELTSEKQALLFAKNVSHAAYKDGWRSTATGNLLCPKCNVP